MIKILFKILLLLLPVFSFGQPMKAVVQSRVAGSGGAADSYWDVPTAVYDSKFFDVSAQSPTPTGAAMSPDGLILIVLDFNSVLYRYNLSVAGDISTAVYASQSYDFSATASGGFGMSVKSDGTKFLVTTGDVLLVEITCTTGWNLTTASITDTYDLSALMPNPAGVSYNSDGTKVYVLDNTNMIVYQFAQSTAYNLTTISYSSIFKDISAQDTEPNNVKFSADGSAMYHLGQTNDRVYQYLLGTNDDVSTATFDDSFLLTGENDNHRGLFFRGTKFYALSGGGQTIFQYTVTVI